MRAAEDAEIMQQAPTRRDGTSGSGGGGGGGGDEELIHEQWARLAEWVDNGGLGRDEAKQAQVAETLDGCDEWEPTPLQRRASRARRILDSNRK